MIAVLAVAGAAVIAIAVVDALWTVFWSDRGAGPISTLVVQAIAWILYGMAGGRRLVRSATGPLALAGIAALWASLLLAGFSLVLQAMPDGVRSASSGRSADAVERVYFAGYSIFTLGNGDFQPHGAGAQAVTVAMSAIGMVMITLSVTYLTPVLGASVASRSFASSATALGETAGDVVADAWHVDRIALDDHLRSLSSQLATLAEQHLAYPVLHLFHSRRVSASAPRAVALLDDVLVVLDAVDPAVAPPLPTRRQLSSSIDDYLDSFGPGRDRAEDPAPAPSLDPLRLAGVPLAPGIAAAADLDLDEDRRRRLQSVLDADGVTAPAADR